jgi:hypothetical protein
METNVRDRVRPFFAGALAAAFVLCSLPGCGSADEGDHRENVMTRRDINLVKEAHAGELMSLSGVVGVYVGALDDGKPCIGVMVVKKSPALLKKIPGVLEGYPVKVDETGEIKPLR